MGGAEPPHRPRQGERLSGSAAADLWSSAEYEPLAQRFAPVHDELVARLGLAPGVRWLDVATGTGEVARRAAAAGADVTGLDIAPAMLELARRKLPALTFELGDCQALPYPDASFDVVSSAFGVMFAPDHRASADELARVCRDRLGLAVWEPDVALGEVYAQFGLDVPEGKAPFRWGKPDYLHGLLDGAFELEVERQALMIDGASGEEVWELWANASPLFRAQVASLEPAERDRFHAAYVAYCEGFRVDGGVSVPRWYLLVLGSRR